MEMENRRLRIKKKNRKIVGLIFIIIGIALLIFFMLFIWVPFLCGGIYLSISNPKKSKQALLEMH